MSPVKRYTHTRWHQAAGEKRGSFEQAVADRFDKAEVSYLYEPGFITYTQPERVARYKPDFILMNGIIVEVKGQFESADRKKHRLIKEQHPDLDIRFCFSNPNSYITKDKITTYAMWCERYGFLYTKRIVPLEWAFAPLDMRRVTALMQFNLKLQGWWQ